MIGFPFTMPYTVRVADINYGGHVANSAVLNFFQDARIAFLRELGGFSEIDVGEQAGLILPEANVRYRAEMFLHDRLRIGVRVKEVRRSALVLEYRIERDGETTAEGTTSLVAFDYGRRKSRRLPEGFRRALEQLEREQDGGDDGEL